ncbi:MFS transporter [Promicromonospora sp. MEB111]|uniref:MFS transporter n=1 Tax=unclassified Promicromonospora TaxID=2647929 RepID=UPI00254A3E13|nr:MFS transporter [Promicromonospora sp. MEB111]
MSPRSERFTLLIAVLAGAAFVASLTQTLVVPVLPTAPAELGVTGAQASWLVTVTIIAGAVANPLLGRLGDLFDRRKILLLAIGAFVVGSLVVASGDGIVMLLVGRGLQGISVAAIPLGISVLASVVPPQGRAHGIAVVSAMMGVGGAVGLPLAGVISEAWGFPGLFWFATAIGAMVFAAVWVVVPPLPPAAARGGIDLPGAVLLVVGLTALFLAISQAQGWGVAALGVLAAAGVTFILFGLVERRSRQPIVDLRLARTRSVLVTNVAGVLTGFAMFVGVLGPITVAQMPTGVGFGLTVAVAGLCMLPGGVLMAVLAPVAARLIARVGARASLLVAGVVILAGFGFRFVFDAELWQLIIATTIIFGGAAVAYAVMPALILGAAPARQVGEASGLNALARNVGSALASATFGALSSGSAPTADGIGSLFALGAVAAGLLLVTTVLLPRLPGNTLDHGARH